jgi:hypothetical protein
MIDPVSIGVAFATARGAVDGIKKAMALGKDISQLYGEFSKFFTSSDEIHTASAKLRIQSANRSDADIRGMAFQVALASKKLREEEKALKNILIYSGNGDVWEDMMKERVRIYKERAAAAVEIERQKRIKREELAKVVEVFLYFVGGVVVLIPFVTLCWAFFMRFIG